MLRHRKSSKLTAGFFLHELPLAVDDTEDEQGQKDSGQGAADDGRQGCVPRAGGRGWDLHEVDLTGTWKPQEWSQPALNSRGTLMLTPNMAPPLIMASLQCR